MSLRVAEVDYSSLDDTTMGEILEVVNTVGVEANPRFVPLDLEEYRLFSDSPGRIRHRFLALDDNERVLGVAEAGYRDDGTNPDRLWVQISVSAESRRQGVATALLARIAELGEVLGRSRLHSWHFGTIPAGAEFSRAIGGTEGLQFHDNVVKIADLDLALLSSWADEGPSRARGYRVDVIEGSWPEEALDDIAHLYFVLERDMPLAEGIEPRVWDRDLVASIQDHYQKGTESISALAVQEDTGTVVGLTQLLRRNADPSTWIVSTTMVDPEHRGKGLGKWVKAAANLEALSRWPDGVYEETGNAFTNEPMLAINRAMGFVHELTTTDVELDVEDAKRYVQSKGLQAGGAPGTSSSGL